MKIEQLDNKEIKVKKVYEVKRGKLKFKEVMDFNSKISEILWKLSMKSKGCKVKEIQLKYDVDDMNELI